MLQRSAWGGLETVGAAASTALAWGGTALTWLGVWLFRIAIGAVLVFLALGIVSQVGTTFWLPVKGAWSAGRASNSNADFAAGAGVALSVILAAASSFNPGFNAWLSAQLQSLPLNPTFALDFHGWFPAASIQPWTELFESSSGFPEFGLIVVTLLVGIVSLAFGGQGDYRETGPMAVATASIARVTTTLLLTLIILYDVQARQRLGSLRPPPLDGGPGHPSSELVGNCVDRRAEAGGAGRRRRHQRIAGRPSRCTQASTSNA